MLDYVFMQRSLVVGVLLGVIIPLVGVTVVLKRLSMIGDALSHTSLAGVAGGLVAGVSPVAGAVVACLAGALCVEGVRRRFREQSELAVAIVMATGIGLAGVLSGFVPNASSFNSFMFGSILTVSAEETVGIAAVSLLAIAFCVLARALSHVVRRKTCQGRGGPGERGKCRLRDDGCARGCGGGAHGGFPHRVIDDGGAGCLCPAARP